MKNAASLEEDDREFLSLMWQLAAVDQKRQAMMDALLDLDETESSSEKKIPNVPKYREKIFLDLESFNSQYSLLEEKRKEVQKRSNTKIIWNNK